MVKSDLKIIISLCFSKFVRHSVEMSMLNCFVYISQSENKKHVAWIVLIWHLHFCWHKKISLHETGLLNQESKGSTTAKLRGIGWSSALWFFYCYWYFWIMLLGPCFKNNLLRLEQEKSYEPLIQSGVSMISWSDFFNKI